MCEVPGDPDKPPRGNGPRSKSMPSTPQRHRGILERARKNWNTCDRASFMQQQTRLRFKHLRLCQNRHSARKETIHHTPFSRVVARSPLLTRRSFPGTPTVRHARGQNQNPETENKCHVNLWTWQCASIATATQQLLWHTLGFTGHAGDA